MTITLHQRARKGWTAAYYRPVITLAQRRPEILHRIRDQLGYGYVTGSACSQFRVSGLQYVPKFLERVLPYLFVKREEAIVLLEFIEKFPHLSDRQKHRYFKKLRELKR